MCQDEGRATRTEVEAPVASVDPNRARAPDTHRACCVLLGLVLALPLFAADASSQQRHVSLGAGWYNPGGADFEDTESGPGLDVVFRMAVGERFHLGLGGQWNAHDVDFTDDDWDVLGVFVEPSLDLTGPGRVQPFVAGRIGWVRQSITAASGHRSGTGFGVGGFVGVRVSLGSGISLEGAVPIYHLSFGDVEIDGVERADSDSSGRAVGLRVALNIGL